MKKEEVIILESNGVDTKRIKALSKSLNGYSELKKELQNMQKIIIEKNKEIELLNKKLQKSQRSKLLDGLRE